MRQLLKIKPYMSFDLAQTASAEQIWCSLWTLAVRTQSLTGTASSMHSLTSLPTISTVTELFELLSYYTGEMYRFALRIYNCIHPSFVIYFQILDKTYSVKIFRNHSCKLLLEKVPRIFHYFLTILDSLHTYKHDTVYNVCQTIIIQTFVQV